MAFRKAWGTHLPLLMAVVEHTEGPILEVGMGLFSTPYLHFHCMDSKRKIVSYENEPKFFEKGCLQFVADYHEVHFVEKWEDMPVEGDWTVALVDQAPEAERVNTIRKLAPYAKYIIAHDADRSTEKQYHYRDIYPLFKYRHLYIGTRPQSIVFSNHDDLTWLTRP